MQVNSLAPVIVSVSDLLNKKDLLDNDVVEAVVRVYFTTMEKLRSTLSSIQKEKPSQLKLFRHSYTDDVMTVAKSVMFSIGGEGYKLIAEQEACDRVADAKGVEALTDSLDEVPELDTFLYPLIVAISEPTRKKNGDIQVVESKLSIHFPNMGNMVATERLILRLDPKTDIQTHLKSNKDNIVDVADFMIHATEEQLAKETGRPLAMPQNLAASGVSVASSILSAGVQEDYFPTKKVEEPAE